MHLNNMENEITEIFPRERKRFSQIKKKKKKKKNVMEKMIQWKKRDGNKVVGKKIGEN